MVDTMVVWYGTGGMCVDALVCQGKVMERDAQRTIEKKIQEGKVRISALEKRSCRQICFNYV